MKIEEVNYKYRKLQSATRIQGANLRPLDQTENTRSFIKNLVAHLEQGNEDTTTTINPNSPQYFFSLPFRDLEHVYQITPSENKGITSNRMHVFDALKKEELSAHLVFVGNVSKSTVAAFAKHHDTDLWFYGKQNNWDRITVEAVPSDLQATLNLSSRYYKPETNERGFRIQPKLYFVTKEGEFIETSQKGLDIPVFEGRLDRLLSFIDNKAQELLSSNEVVPDTGDKHSNTLTGSNSFDDKAFFDQQFPGMLPTSSDPKDAAANVSQSNLENASTAIPVSPELSFGRPQSPSLGQSQVSEDRIFNPFQDFLDLQVPQVPQLSYEVSLEPEVPHTNEDVLEYTGEATPDSLEALLLMEEEDPSPRPRKRQLQDFLDLQVPQVPQLSYGVSLEPEVPHTNEDVLEYTGEATPDSLEALLLMEEEDPSPRPQKRQRL